MDEKTLSGILARLNRLERNSAQLRQGAMTGTDTVDLGSSGVGQGAAPTGDFTSNRRAALVAGNKPPVILPSEIVRNVTRYGDTGTADDSSVFAQAIANAPAGGVVFAPPATYIVGEVEMASDVTVWAPGAIFKQEATAASTFNFATGVEGATLREVTIDGNSPNVTSGVAVQIRGARNCIRDCRIYDAESYAVQLVDGTDYAKVINNWIYAVNAAKSFITGGISLFGTTQADAPRWALVAGNHIFDGDHSAINGGSTRDTVIANNICASDSGIDLHDSDNLNLSVVGNKVTSSVLNGIHLAGNQLTVTGNLVEGAVNDGINLSDTGVLTPCEEATISGNTVIGSGNHGIAVNSGVGLSITGNTSKGNGGSGIVLTDYNGVTISGNTSKDNTVHGIFVSSSDRVSVTGNDSLDNTQRGISIAGTSTEVVVSGNTSSGNTVSQTRVQDTANALFADNILVGTLPFSKSGTGTMHVHHTASGTPAGVIVCHIGSTWHRTDGGAGTSFYVKETNDNSSAGWVAK